MWQEAIGLARSYGRRDMPATYILLALIAVVFVLEGGITGGEQTSLVVQAGAQINGLVAQGQWWRIVTAIFIHWSWMHILLNGWSLYVMGEIVEPSLGSRRFVGIFLLGGIMGGLVSLVAYGPYEVLAGASGAIFGLLGATGVIALDARGPAKAYLLRWLGSILVINLVFDVMNSAQIGIWDHLGGFIGGALATYMIGGVGSSRHGTTRAYIGGAAFVILAAFCVAYSQRGLG